MHSILSVFPNEKWQLIVKFANDEYRLINLSIPRNEFGWVNLSHPQLSKRFNFDSMKITWDFGGKLNADYLYENSIPATSSDLEKHSIFISVKDHAPTIEDNLRHEYYVYLRPLNKNLFFLGDCVGGYRDANGPQWAYSLTEMLLLEEWKRHFVLSGCGWATQIIETNQKNVDVMVDLLIAEICKRAAPWPHRSHHELFCYSN